MAKELVLRDSTPAAIWALSPNDARGLREHYRHLSTASKYNRFLSAAPILTDDMLRRLVDEVDGVDHVALVLSVYPADDVERGVGIGRLVRYPEQPSAADIAVTVADDWHGRGVATALLSELVRCRRVGVTGLITEVAEDNVASLALLARLGDVHVGVAIAGSRTVQVQLRE